MPPEEEMETIEANERAIEACISHMEIGWMPLHDLYRERFGFDGGEPTETELRTVLEIAELLMDHHDVRCLFGPDMEEAEWTSRELRLHFLQVASEKVRRDRLWRLV